MFSEWNLAVFVGDFLTGLMTDMSGTILLVLVLVLGEGVFEFCHSEVENIL